MTARLEVGVGMCSLGVLVEPAMAKRIRWRLELPTEAIHPLRNPIAVKMKLRSMDSVTETIPDVPDLAPGTRVCPCPSWLLGCDRCWAPR